MTARRPDRPKPRRCHADRPRIGARRVTGLLALACLGPLASCTVGPDFETPAPPEVATYTTGAEPTGTVAADETLNSAGAGAAQQFLRDRDIPAEWWALFESPELDALVRQALADSPMLAQAEAKLARAEAELDGRSGETRLPQVDVSAAANRIDVESGAVDSPLLEDEFPFTVSTASVGVSYSLDLFGRNRRELEALSASVEYEQFQLEGARLMLAGNVVTTAIREATLRKLIEATEAAVTVQTRQLEILRELEQLGSVSRLDVVLRESEIARTRATLPALERDLDQTRHLLAIFLGQPPGAATLPELDLGTDLKLPTELPLSLPSDLARQRPDIRAAEALLHEASARVGVAAAGFYPQIGLSANLGGVQIPPLLDGTAGFTLLAASIAQPLFNGGAIRAEQRAAEAAFDQAGAAYREVVLSALQDVADVLVALEADARALSEHAQAASLAKTAYDIMSGQYAAGAVSLITLLDAERQYISSTLDETRAAGARFADTAALFQALGGGWWSESTAQ